MGDFPVDRVDKLVVDRYRNRALRTEAHPEGMATATVRRDVKMLRAAWA